MIYGGKYETFDPITPARNDLNHFYHGIHALKYFNFADTLGTNYIIEGVTIIEPNGYCLKVIDRINGLVKNVKCLAYRYSTDGVGASFGIFPSVSNCFFK